MAPTMYEVVCIACVIFQYYVIHLSRSAITNVISHALRRSSYVHKSYSRVKRSKAMDLISLAAIIVGIMF